LEKNIPDPSCNLMFQLQLCNGTFNQAQYLTSPNWTLAPAIHDHSLNEMGDDEVLPKALIGVQATSFPFDQESGLIHSVGSFVPSAQPLWNHGTRWLLKSAYVPG
jgi:hypothetical protein